MQIKSRLGPELEADLPAARPAAVDRDADLNIESSFKATKRHAPGQFGKDYVRNTRQFMGHSLLTEAEFERRVKTRMAKLRAANGGKDNAAVDRLNVMMTIYKKIVRGIRSDVAKRRFRGMGRFRSKLFQKMGEHLQPSLGHYGGAGIKASRAGWAISIPDQETYDMWRDETALAARVIAASS